MGDSRRWPHALSPSQTDKQFAFCRAHSKSSAYAFTVLYNPALTVTKVSILMLYYRMSQARPFFRYATLTVGLVVILNGIVLTFLNIFRCQPISGAFTEQAATCIDVVTLFICSAPVNVLTDIAILVIPLPMVTAMRLGVRQKVGLVATFMLGVFVTVVDVVRIVYLQEALIYQIGADITSSPLADFSWHASYSLMWSAIEVNVGLICACALVIKPLLIRIVPGKSRSYSRSQFGPVASDTFNSRTTPPLTPPPHGLDSKVSRPECSEDGSADRSPSDAVVPSFPTTTAQAGPNDEDREMDLSEFLVAEDGAMDDPPRIETTRPDGARRLTSASTLEPLNGGRTSAANRNAHKAHTMFTDFVNLSKRKPLTELTRREAWWLVLFGEHTTFHNRIPPPPPPGILQMFLVAVSIVLWTQGFAYGQCNGPFSEESDQPLKLGLLLGLLNSLTGQLRSLSQYDPVQSLILHHAYFCGSVLGPPAAFPVFARAGFKATIITGLCVFTVATLTFWPSSSLLSFPGFVVSNILMGSGLSIIQLAANTFITLAGPDELMECRFNFGHGLQAIGTLVSPLLAIKVLFKDITHTGLFHSQWLYLALSLWSSLLGVIVYYVPLCEASDDDLERVAKLREQKGLSKRAKLCGIRVMPFVAVTSIFAVWLYIGTQEQLRYFWNNLMMEVKG